MKDTILVNLVSDQTIPNVQFVKWYFNQNHLPMKIFLLSTKEMEKKQKSECIKRVGTAFGSAPTLYPTCGK